MPKKLENPLEHYIPVPECGCWLWLGGEAKGYGIVSNYPFRKKAAHRYFYEMLIGPIPPGMDLCHKCDTPLCVNPAHLFPGSRRKNIEDSMSKGRFIRGSRVGTSKLTSAQVEQIRELKGWVYQKVIAEAYGIDQSSVSLIQSGKNWKYTYKAEHIEH